MAGFGLKAAVAAGIVLSLSHPGAVAHTDNIYMEGQAPDVTPIVETTYGPVQGFVDRGINEYLGINYAKAPVGDLRFKPPVAPDKVDYIMDATIFGPPVMQMYNAAGGNRTDETRQLQSTNANQAEVKLGNEDGLYLNVWTPAADNKKRPVMFWIHGGGFAYGSGSWPVYDGNNLAQKDVVVITVNHRLNVFGYLYLGDKFGEDYAKSGNLGQLDLIAALQWVQDNVEKFGGDPDNVTVFGESGGGFKISNLMATPAAEGLFAKAIIESGPAADSGDKAEAAKLTDLVLAEAGIETIEDLQAIPPKDLMAAAAVAQGKARRAGINAGFNPIVDGVVLPAQPFADGAPSLTKNVPLLIGWNKDEMTIFNRSAPWFGSLTEEAMNQMASRSETTQKLIELYKSQRPDDTPTYIYNSAASAMFVSESFVLADEREKADSAPTYMYHLEWESNAYNGRLRSAHTLEIPLVFNNVEESRAILGTGPGAVVMGEMMSDAWVNFARTGVPSSDLLPEWKPYDLNNRYTMRLDLRPELASDPLKEMREIVSAGR